jgi:hypothetical protein
MGTVEAAEAHGFEDGGSSLLFYRVAGDDVLHCLTECSGARLDPANEQVTMAMTHYHDEGMQKQPVLGGHPVATTHAATKERQPANTFFYPCRQFTLEGNPCCPFNASVGDYAGDASLSFNVPVGRLCRQRESSLQRRRSAIMLGR